MRSQHIWTSRDEDGRKREVRVTKFGGNWKFQAKFHDEERMELLRRPADRRSARAAGYHFPQVSAPACFGGGLRGRRQDAARPDPQWIAGIPSSWHPTISATSGIPLLRWGNGVRRNHEPLVLVGGEGAILRDSRGREYIDGNSSIWTNVHGHNHPRINAAIREQLERVAHTSFLGTTNPPAIKLAREIVKLFPEENIRTGILLR